MYLHIHTKRHTIQFPAAQTGACVQYVCFICMFKIINVYMYYWEYPVYCLSAYQHELLSTNLLSTASVHRKGTGVTTFPLRGVRNHISVYWKAVGRILTRAPQGHGKGNANVRSREQFCFEPSHTCLGILMPGLVHIKHWSTCLYNVKLILSLCL